VWVFVLFFSDLSFFSSVATTSTKAPSVIKADIRRVLDRMQVQYRDMKGGFECIHLPSIDLTSVETSTNKGSQHLQASSTSGDTSSMIPISNSRRSIVKRASKLSFTLKRDKGKEKDHSVDNNTNNKDKDGRPSEATILTTTPSSDSSSFINVASNHTVVLSQQDKETNLQTQANGPPLSIDVDAIPPVSASLTPIPNKAKVLPPIPRDYAQPSSPLPVRRSPSPLPTGEVDRDVFESMGNNSLSVRFEINIVKVRDIGLHFIYNFNVVADFVDWLFIQVPWLPLHGIQFRRASGDGWQYQMLARRVLTELKL
jgi:hypothetical protein